MRRSLDISLALALAATLTACASKRGTPDNEPTLKTLAGRSIEVAPDAGIATNEAKAIAAYREFLAAAPSAAQRAEALRRLGDLEMDQADQQAAPDYRVAIGRYRDLLKAYPKDPGNDRVLYQLARAQEQGGELDAALATLDRLVAEHPATPHIEEAQFRRGELLFTLRDYAKAEAAYAAVLKTDGPYQQRALYMHGWSVFKQGRLDEALASFFGVLDHAIAGRDDAELAALQSLSRADRELVEDTFRITSLCLQNLQGAESIPAFMTSDARRSYEFRVYSQLGELYLKQERVKDAADTFSAFARRQPLHAQAPILQARVIGIYQDAGFASLSLEAKKEYVQRYGSDSAFRQANPQGWADKAQPLVKTHLAELARHYHASAQKSHTAADVQEAVRWYRAYLASFPKEPDSAQANFLLAELLFEDGRHAEATAEYERTAYAYPLHARSADAGYAALLGHAALEKAAQGDALAAAQRAEVASAVRFAEAFPSDERTAPVLTRAAEQLYALRDGDQAAALAQRVLALQPPAPAAQRRVAGTVLAHTAFDRGAFAEAERAYADVLALVPAQDAARAGLVERLAACAYKQGEQARATGQARDAVAHFNRVAQLAPQSAVRANAQYDAAAELIGLKDWGAATQALEDFRRRYPQHALNGEVNKKLALAYVEQGQWAPAAAEFERLAAGGAEPEVARGALWQAAELYDKAGARASAAKAYERYLQQHPQPLEPAVEARFRLGRIAQQDGQGARALGWMKQVQQADAAGGAARTGRTRTLGALAALALAEPSADAYRGVALVEPLAKQLKLKKARLEDALKAYALAADYGVAEASTAAAFHTAALYQDFGRALLASQRPKKLSKAELEQYNVMLEEQAFPFEEKAAELHELNARRAAAGLYDEWVQRSYQALAQLKPARFGKVERSEAPAGTLPEAQQLNQQGMAHRRKGEFAQARQAYEKAMALQPQFAAPVLNLGVLLDLYLNEPAPALALYERYLALAGTDPAVSKWVAELRNRKPPVVATGPVSGKEKE